MSSTFYTIRELSEKRIPKGELAVRYYPEEQYTIDCALPQSWIDDAWERGMDKYCEGSNLAGHFVTVYPKDGSPAFIGPITMAGIRIMSILATVK